MHSACAAALEERARDERAASRWALLRLAAVALAMGALVLANPGWAVPTLTALGATLGTIVFRGFAARRAFRRCARATETDDAPALREALHELRRVQFFGRARIAVECFRALLPTYEERWSDAAAAWELLLQRHRDRLGPYAAVAESNLAWALAHDGDGPRAIALAQAVVAQLEPQGGPFLAAALGTLGSAQAIGGDAAEACRVLDRSLGLGGTPRHLAARQFSLGHARARLGEHAGACAAWRAARDAAPASSWATRASARLEEPAPAPGPSP